MDTQFLGIGHTIIERIYQVGFSTPYPSPQIQSDLGLWTLLLEKPPQATHTCVSLLFLCQQTLVKILQQRHRLFLSGIVRKVLSLQVQLISLQRRKIGIAQTAKALAGLDLRLPGGNLAHFSDCPKAWQCYSRDHIVGIIFHPSKSYCEESSVYSLNMVLLGGAILLFVSLGLGILIGRRMSPQGQKNRELETKLDQALQDKKSYEDDVVEHFSDTAVLLNKLTESYRDVHNQLAKGATTLCEGQGPVSLEKIDGESAGAEIPGHLADVQPPLDYAPKSSPDETGMLNEEFGLERVKSEAAAAEAPAK